MSIEFGLLVVTSYLLGSVPMAYLVARYLRGIDLRQYGSGHSGASNVRRTISMRVALPVVFYDFFKGVLIVVVAILLGMSALQQVIIGIAVIIGHNWPVFLRFNGGRGLAASMGVAFSLMPWGIAVFIVVGLLYFVVKSTPLPVLIAMAALPVAGWVLGEPTAIIIGLLILFLLMVTRRLTAPKTATSATVSIRELLINRLLFDRDIKDSHAWMYRKPPEDGAAQPSAKQPETPEKGT
ncbi:glycerol-3-phosphate acyltransferase [Chloroflexota bacterium]